MILGGLARRRPVGGRRDAADDGRRDRPLVDTRADQALRDLAAAATRDPHAA